MLTINTVGAERTLTLSGDATISGTNTGDQTITLTGDVTGSGTGSFAATIAGNAVTDAKLRQSAAISVIGRAAGTIGNVADIAASADGQVLRCSGGALSFSTMLFADLGGNPTTLAGYGITDAYTKTEVDNLLAGLDVKGSVKAASAANLTLAGAQTVDGVAVVVSDLVLVKNQTVASQNGIYTVASGAWTRAANMDAWAEMPGAFVWVEQGTVNADTGWVCTVDVGGTLDTTPVTWSQFGGIGTYIGTDGVTISGNQVSLTPGVIATPGTYRSVTVDTYGRVTAGSNPTTLAGYGITDALSNATGSQQAAFFGDVYIGDAAGNSHLRLHVGTDLLANRTLTITPGDADRTLTLSGNLTVSATATVSGTNTGDQNAAGVALTPVGDIAATTVQAAVQELDTEKAPKASPSFTGNVYIGDRGDGYGAALLMEASSSYPAWHVYVEKSSGAWKLYHHRNAAGTVIGVTSLMVGNAGDVSIAETLSVAKAIESNTALKVRRIAAVSGKNDDLILEETTDYASGESHNIQWVGGGSTVLGRMGVEFDGTDCLFRFRDLYDAGASRTGTHFAIGHDGTGNPNNHVQINSGLSGSGPTIRVLSDDASAPLRLHPKNADTELVSGGLKFADASVQSKAALPTTIATVSPAVTDDSAAGYQVGQHWINTALKTEWVCFDATTGAAVWLPSGSAAGADANTILHMQVFS